MEPRYSFYFVQTLTSGQQPRSKFNYSTHFEFVRPTENLIAPQYFKEFLLSMMQKKRSKCMPTSLPIHYYNTGNSRLLHACIPLMQYVCMNTQLLLKRGYFVQDPIPTYLEPIKSKCLSVLKTQIHLIFMH